MTRTTRSTRRRRPPRRVERLIVLVTACLLIGAGAVIAATNHHQGEVATNRGAPTKATSPTPTPTPTLTPTASPTPTPRPKTRDVPARGPGTFTAVRGTAATGGDGPQTITYRVEIENSLPFDLAATTTQIDGILGHRRGWTRTGRYTFKRAPDGELRIKVATPETTDRLCRPLRTNGRLSCRNGDTVVINARRWSRGIDAYKGLTSYRHYVINHEVGHALGQRHRPCPAAGRAAPVMQQQTISMQRCQPNPWPTRAERQDPSPLPSELNHPKGTS